MVFRGESVRTSVSTRWRGVTTGGLIAVIIVVVIVVVVVVVIVTIIIVIIIIVVVVVVVVKTEDFIINVSYAWIFGCPLFDCTFKVRLEFRG